MNWTSISLLNLYYSIKMRKQDRKKMMLNLVKINKADFIVPYNHVTHVFLCQVIKELQMRMIYTAEEKYTVKKSNYSSNVVSSNSALRPSQFLTTTIDVDEKRQLEEQLRVRDAHLTHGHHCFDLLSSFTYFGFFLTDFGIPELKKMDNNGLLWHKTP